jgi:hypothetical protein
MTHILRGREKQAAALAAANHCAMRNKKKTQNEIGRARNWTGIGWMDDLTGVS